MRRNSILSDLRRLGKQVFTTRELSSISRRSLSTTTQSLNNLARQGVIAKVYRGVWAEGAEAVSPYVVVPYLFGAHRVYVSFISALHMHGIIEQIPQTVTLASTAHARVIRTKFGVFYAHHISPSFFKGFGWYKGSGSFLIAEPEKALVDSLYLSSYKGKRFGNFPELHFAKSFSFKKAEEWVKNIPGKMARSHVSKKLSEIRAVYEK